ncbi:MAG: helix-turn-helix domain-containing protein, partial [Stenotrophomonas sp.]
LRVPPLRERRGDLPQLAGTILNRLAQSQGQKPPQLAASALEALDAYSFPGNVRELENILERSLALADSDRIDASDLRLPQPQTAIPRAPSSETPAPVVTPQEAVVDIDPASAALPSYIEQMERTVIQKALEENRWNKTKTAAQLGITFRALRYKLKKLGME